MVPPCRQMGCQEMSPTTSFSEYWWRGRGRGTGEGGDFYIPPPCKNSILFCSSHSLEGNDLKGRAQDPASCHTYPFPTFIPHHPIGYHVYPLSPTTTILCQLTFISHHFPLHLVLSPFSVHQSISQSVITHCIPTVMSSCPVTPVIIVITCSIVTTNLGHPLIIEISTSSLPI